MDIIIFVVGRILPCAKDCVMSTTISYLEEFGSDNNDDEDDDDDDPS
jgi:hypothetical protein